MPSDTYPVRKMVSITEEMSKAIDRERRAHDPMPSESEIMRRALQLGLAAMESARTQREATTRAR